MTIEELRREYHRQICSSILFLKGGNAPNIADTHSQGSVALAQGIVERIGLPLHPTLPSGQTAGKAFEEITKDFLEKAFRLLAHLRPGAWEFSVHGRIADFDQYKHLADLSRILEAHKELRATLGDYLIQPDILIGRRPVSDDEINQRGIVITDNVSRLTPFRSANVPSLKLILHASISCKWTIRSDRSQNSRTEGLNLIRNRKGHTPHIMIVTAEPLPHRIASVALGTGDIDCVYHMALPELQAAAKDYDNEAVTEMLDILVEGNRLRDIGDLPLDLAI